MEGLSLHLKKGKVEGKLSRVKVFKLVKILQLFFLDTVLIMTKVSVDEWKEIKEILLIFCNASGFLINWTKSTFLFVGIKGESLEKIKKIFPYNFVDLSKRF